MVTVAPQYRNPTWQMARARVAGVAFFGVAALIISAIFTTLWCSSMPAMGGMAMSGGWTMSMTWMRMPGQTWPGAAASFTGMWSVMMIAMMLPSLTPTLWRYREAVGRAGIRTAMVGVGYFLVWTALGLAVFVAGALLAAVEMRHEALAGAVPLAAGIVVTMAGAFQFTGWKARHLACCREVPQRGCALWVGLRLGLHCICGCAGMTAILLVLGVMDLRAMAVVTAAITAERVAPSGERVARGIGAVAIAAGLFLTAQA